MDGVMVEPLDGDQHGQQVRVGDDDVIVQPPLRGQVLQVSGRLRELQAAIEEHDRNVRIDLTGEVDNNG